ncbi:TPA: hypothetical protein ACRTTK_003116 [Aeromonas hydrophila]
MEGQKKESGKSRSQRFKESQKALGNKQLAVWATPAAMLQWGRVKALSRGTKEADNNTVLSNIAKVISTMDDMEIIDRLSKPAP